MTGGGSTVNRELILRFTQQKTDKSLNIVDVWLFPELITQRPAVEEESTSSNVCFQFLGVMEAKGWVGGHLIPHHS